VDGDTSAVVGHIELGQIDLNKGRLRDTRRFGNECWSDYQMSMLESEWRSLRA